MYHCTAITKLDEFFLDYDARTTKGVFFYRIAGYNEDIRTFIARYYEAARGTGVFIEGRIPNPDEKNLGYYEEIMGMSFRMSLGFFTSALIKWLPRLDEMQRNHLAASIYDALDKMRHEGKNEDILKNAYTKFMCWLYYKFERMLNQLGRNKLPKILYEGYVSNYELKLLGILAGAGCDILLLQYAGDEGYLKIDPASKYSSLYKGEGQQGFPEGFSVRSQQGKMVELKRMSAVYGSAPGLVNCTNVWVEGKPFEDILKSVPSRGSDSRFYYNCFLRVRGVEDKSLYENDLLQLYIQLQNSGRKTVVVEGGITPPDTGEIEKIKRRNYGDMTQMLADLSRNIQYSANPELQQIMKKNFVDLLMEESSKNGGSVNRLMNKAVYLLCWLNRYRGQLFEKWKAPDISVFLFLGTCKNENEALFIRFLSRLPIDVLLLSPNLDAVCVLEDQTLFEKRYDLSMSLDKFPRENGDIRLGTAAYHAEQELNTIMYQDTGLYRDQQYTRAVTVSLQTMYEEISILWAQEAKFRPNFNVIDNTVTVPVLFAKVSGVKDGNAAAYWQEVKKLVTGDTYVIKAVPFTNSTEANPMKQHSTELLKNGKVQKIKIRKLPSYPYGYLREEMQEYILDKIQLLIDRKTISGTFTNGGEYTIAATLLNLNKEILRLIQKLDFTKILPKIICIDTAEAVYSLEDSIILAFLNLIGFDIVIFTPTGYRNIEQHYNGRVVEEHQAGEYLYDMKIPELGGFQGGGKRSLWLDRLFNR